MKKNLLSKVLSVLISSVMLMISVFSTGITASATNTTTSVYSSSGINYVKVTGLMQSPTLTVPFDPSVYESPPNDSRIVEIRTYYDYNNDGILNGIELGAAASTGFVLPDRNGKSIIGTAAHCVAGAAKIEVRVNSVQFNQSVVYTADSYHVPQTYYNGTNKGTGNDYAIITVDDPNVSNNFFYLAGANTTLTHDALGFFRCNRGVSTTYSDATGIFTAQFIAKEGQSGAPMCGGDYVFGIVSGYVMVLDPKGNWIPLHTIGPQANLNISLFMVYNHHI